MRFKSILGSACALLLLSGAVAPAAGTAQPSDSGFSIHLPSFGLPGVFSDSQPQGVQVAQQSGGNSVQALEEQIRALNGTVEELNFQVLQMQEQLRKMQEDNEYRFQQLEQGGQKKSDATVQTNQDVAAAPAAPSTGATPPANGQSVQEIIVESGNGEPGAVQGSPPKTFGTITVDKNGNVVEAAPVDNGAQAAGTSDTQVAALPSSDDPEELYRNSYQFILSGDYGTAEQGFRDHIARFPKDAKASDAHYWLGEALLGQQKYRDAAEVFLAASKDYPKSKKAPDMLLKLGISLVGLKQRDVACATFSEVTKRYPDVSSTLKERIKQERALAAC